VIVVVNAPEVVGYIERKLNIKIAPPFHAFGYMTSDKKPLAGVVVNDYNHSNCEVTMVAEKGGFNLPVMRHLSDYIFNKLGCRRMTVRTKKKNKPMIRLMSKMVKRAGFEFEAVAPHYFMDDDAVLYRLKRENCKWLR
jgi:RimJ/RimL family protein N-acetyltransferase